MSKKKRKTFVEIQFDVNDTKKHALIHKLLTDYYNVNVDIVDENTMHIYGKRKQYLEQVAEIAKSIHDFFDFDSYDKLLNIVEKILNDDEIIVYTHKGKPIVPLTKNQKKYLSTVIDNDITFVVGPAGTGKTFVAIAIAIRLLKNKIIDKIIITRPLVEANEKLGYLPGDIKDKTDPFLRPIYDVLEEIIGKNEIHKWEENGKLEICPIAFMRGRTFKRAIVIVDEAQNITKDQMKMLLTRIGEGSKYIVVGDITQSDINKKSGLTHARERLQGIKGIGFVEMDKRDIRRHPIIDDILKRW